MAVEGRGRCRSRAAKSQRERRSRRRNTNRAIKCNSKETAKGLDPKARCGELWCHGKVDDVVDTKLPISLIHGLYALNGKAQEELKVGKSWKFELSSGDELVECSSAVKKDA